MARKKRAKPAPSPVPDDVKRYVRKHMWLAAEHDTRDVFIEATLETTVTKEDFLHIRALYNDDEKIASMTVHLPPPPPPMTSAARRAILEDAEL